MFIKPFQLKKLCDYELIVRIGLFFNYTQAYNFTELKYTIQITES